MATNTPVSQITYPNQPDVPNVPNDMSAMVSDIDSITVPRFASTAARDTAIPSPASGQHAYVTGSVDKLYVYRANYAAWQPYIQSIHKYKSADETYSTNTTYQDDDHIIGLPYKANTIYTIQGALFVNSPAAADFKFKLIFSSAPQSGQWATWITAAASTADTTSDLITVELVPATQGSTLIDVLNINGQFVTHASTPGTVKLQWAQFASSGTTTVYAGSYLEILEA